MADDRTPNADEPKDENLLNAWSRRLGNDDQRGDGAAGDSNSSPDRADDPDETRTFDPGETRTGDSTLAAESNAGEDAPEGAPVRESRVERRIRRRSMHDNSEAAAETNGTGDETGTSHKTGTADETENIAAAPSYEPENSEPSYAPAAESGDPEHEEPVKKKRRWPVVLLIAILVVAGAYVGAAYFLRDKIPADTKVSGVPVGGLTPAQARERLEAELADLVTQPRTTTLEDGSQSVDIDPQDIGIEIDFDKTLDKLVGFSLDPRGLWAHIVGAENVDAEIATDEALLADEVDRLAQEYAKDAKNATVELNGTTAVVTPAEEGVALDTEVAKERIVDEWFESAEPIELPFESTQADLTTEELQTFADETIAPLLAEPISINIKNSLVELQPEDTASLLTYSDEGGTPSIEVVADGLSAFVEETAGEVLTEAKNATIAISDGAPKITPSTNGEELDTEQIAQDLKAIAGGSNRTVTAEIIVSEPDLTTEGAEELGIKEVVSSISTPLTNDQVRTTNLVVGTAKVTNTLVKPGEQFNLETALGPIDADHGFVSSGVVTNGFNSTAMGGGLSQLSTNMFNIGYRAGMEDISHQPHSKYFDRYPMGLEATLWTGQIPMIWENNTPYGVMVDTWVSDGQVHSRLWSTKHWDVNVWQGDPYAYVQPETRHNPAADCEPMGAGGPGFTVTVGRTVSLDGEVHEDSQYSWTYQPVHAVTCG